MSQLDSIEFKQAVVDFGSDLSKIADDLYEATSEDLASDRIVEIVAAGERKLQEYPVLLEKAGDVRRVEVEKDFGDTIGQIREYLKTLRQV